jgi:TetR/AcrR family transcriptional regulator of autoinduction and epiphytic fitness
LYCDVVYGRAMSIGDAAPIDGRRARRERSREAIIDAVFGLVTDGKVPPTVDDVAERAGVSVSSVFRNFDGLDDLHRQAFDVFAQRFAHLLEPAAPPEAEREVRIGAHVRVRLELFEAAGPMMRVARQRALDYQPIANGVGGNRSALADQTRAHFAAEARQLTPADAANLVAVIDSLTSPEGYEVMGAANGRSHRQISRAWTTALDALLTGWPSLPADDSHVHVVPGTT